MNDETQRDDPASEQTSCGDAEWQAWSDEFGLGSPPKFRDESIAPPVDEDLLRTLLRRELPEYKARGVLILVVSFRSWYEAYSRIMLEEYRREMTNREMLNDEGMTKSE